ncbi:NAC domain-containing protein 8 [Striga asiatica]|uniref:NAC domain-containing protein 8 n=1 Tax=Striga asiatica TaxID=4170 RepID=A0A5A7QYH7_STRAF|nr:NAC domain-containing protein 8 [Striga asiatica]
MDAKRVVRAGTGRERNMGDATRVCSHALELDGTRAGLAGAWTRARGQRPRVVRPEGMDGWPTTVRFAGDGGLLETGITKLGRSISLKDLASCLESVGTFFPGTRKSRSSISLETLSSTKAASTGNNKVESKLVPSYIPQVRPLLHPYVPHTPVYSFHDIAKDESPPELCSKCCLEHLPQQACPVILCTICNKTHRNWTCPYERILPQGADYNRVRFTAVCALDDGGEFDEEKWACTWCHGKVAKLRLKYCCICMCHTDHCSHECRKDVVRAARFKALRDYDLAFPKKWVPYGDFLAEKTSSKNLWY